MDKTTKVLLAVIACLLAVLILRESPPLALAGAPVENGAANFVKSGDRIAVYTATPHGIVQQMTLFDYPNA